MQHAGGMLPPPVQKLVAPLIAVLWNGDAASPISSAIHALVLYKSLTRYSFAVIMLFV